MAKTLTEAEIQETLDRHYPLIDRGAEPPGRYETAVGEHGQLTSRRWVGKRNWSTAHGDAVVRWSLGLPVAVKNAALASGERVNAQGGLGGPSPWRYSLSREPRRWQHGTVDIRPDGATFTPGEQPKYIPPAASEFPNLEFDLAHDNALRERLIDADFADALYAYLKNEDFSKEGGDRIWSPGLSRAGGLVANLRGHGDVYTDYYPYGGDIRNHRPEVFAEITELLQMLGWRSDR